MNLFVKEMLVHRKLIILAKRLMKLKNREAAMFHYFRLYRMTRRLIALRVKKKQQLVIGKWNTMSRKLIAKHGSQSKQNLMTGLERWEILLKKIKYKFRNELI